MKRILLSIFGIFALAACSGDVYQDTEPSGSPGSMEICLVNYPGTPIVPSEVSIAGFTLSFVTNDKEVYIIFQ